MKKKFISIALAAMMLIGSASALAAETNRAILLCYDSAGKLAHSKLLKADEQGNFNVLPSDCVGITNKIYYIDKQEFKNVDTVSSATPVPTPAVTETPAATEKPVATRKPSSDSALKDTPYEKEADELYSPALVTDVYKSVDSNNEEVYRVTTYYLGKEVTIDIDTDMRIRTAPEEYAYMRGQDAGSLKKGDVVWMTANIAGDMIRTIDFITRPTDKDIVTGSADYGENFEKLFAADGSVAGMFNYLKYGGNSTEGTTRNEYAYGIVGKMKGNRLTLLNTTGVVDDAIDISVNSKAYVYSCDVSGKDYEFTLGSISDIVSTLSQKEMNKEVADLSEDNSYNYALVRLCDGVATDIVLFTNYNE